MLLFGENDANTDLTINFRLNTLTNYIVYKYIKKFIPEYTNIKQFIDQCEFRSFNANSFHTDNCSVKIFFQPHIAGHTINTNLIDTHEKYETKLYNNNGSIDVKMDGSVLEEKFFLRCWD